MGRRHGQDRVHKGKPSSAGAIRREEPRVNQTAGAAIAGVLRRRTKRPILRFVLLFIVLMGLFYAATMTSFFDESLFPTIVRFNTHASAAILRVLGVDARATDTTISSSRYSVQVNRECAAIEASVLFAAVVLASPVKFRARLVGVFGGVALLALINVVRIVTLYFTGAYFPKMFNIMHIEVWQPAFIVLALLMWIFWALWATRTKQARHHATH